MTTSDSSIRWLPLAVLLALLLIFDAAAACFAAELRSEYLIGISIGLFFAQIVAIAVATSLLSVHAITRIVAGSLTTLLIGAALALHMRKARSPVPLILAATVFGQWLIYQIPLWSFRLRGWSLVTDDAPQESTSNETQFGLRQVFVWTTIAAVFLAIARLIAAVSTQTESSSPTHVDWLLFGILTIGNSILVLPMMWGVFVRHRMTTWLFGALLWALVLSPIQLFAIFKSIIVGSDELWLFVNINVVQFIVATLLLLSLRYAGLRLHRSTAEAGL